jgi:hypothetical protein
MEAQIQVRRSTAAQWTSANPILASGEPGLETDTRKGKYGDGATRWVSLGYSWQSLATGPTGPAGGGLIGTYPNPTIAPGAIGAGQITDGTVGSAELATGAVTTTKVGDLQVTGIKLADAAVVNAKLGPSAVTTDKIQDGTIALADLAAATVSGLMLDVADEGATIATDATKINFVGAGVTAAAASGVATVTITGAPASSIVAGVIAEWSNSTAPSGWYRLRRHRQSRHGRNPRHPVRDQPRHPPADPPGSDQPEHHRQRRCRDQHRGRWLHGEHGQRTAHQRHRLPEHPRSPGTAPPSCSPTPATPTRRRSCSMRHGFPT